MEVVTTIYQERNVVSIIVSMRLTPGVKEIFVFKSYAGLSDDVRSILFFASGLAMKAPRKTRKKLSKPSKVIRLRIERKPEDFKLLSNHVDWTARFEGSVTSCREEVEREKVKLPPQGVYIKSKRVGHYFFVVSSKHEEAEGDIAELADGFGWTTGDVMPRGWVKEHDKETGLDYYHDEEANVTFWRPQIFSEYTKLSVESDGKNLYTTDRDWSRHWSVKHQKWFYFNSNTNASVKQRLRWADPTPPVFEDEVINLPDGWRCHLYTPFGADNEHSTLYYSNERVGAQWIRPTWKLRGRQSRKMSMFSDEESSKRTLRSTRLGSFGHGVGTPGSTSVVDCPVHELLLIDDSGKGFPLRDYQAHAVTEFRKAVAKANIMIALDKERNCYMYRTSDKKELTITPSPSWLEAAKQEARKLQLHSSKSKVSRHSCTLNLQIQASEPLNLSLTRKLEEGGMSTDLLLKQSKERTELNSPSPNHGAVQVISFDYERQMQRRYSAASPKTKKIPRGSILKPRPNSAKFGTKLPDIPQPPSVAPPPKAHLHLTKATAQSLWQYVSCAYRCSKLMPDGKTCLVSTALSQRKVYILLVKFLGSSVIATSFQEWEQLRVWQACARCHIGLREQSLRDILQRHLAKKLLYRASRDGWDKRSFMDKCCWTRAQAMLILCRSAGNKKRFGGVTQAPIEAPPEYNSRWVCAPHSFLFSLDPPRIFQLKSQESPSAVCFWGQATQDLINFGEYDLSIVVCACHLLHSPAHVLVVVGS